MWLIHVSGQLFFKQYSNSKQPTLECCLQKIFYELTTIIIIIMLIIIIIIINKVLY